MEKIILLKEDYLNYIKACKSEGTFRSYYHHLNSILNWFLKNNFVINKNNLILFIEYCKKKGLTNKTINHRIIVLKAMLKYSNIESDIMAIKKLTVIVKPFDCLKDEELKKLKDYIINSDITIKNKLALALLYETGVRLRELVNIEICNIDFNNKVILLTETKTKNIRYVFYTDFTKQFLDQVDLSSKYLFDYKEHGVYKIFVRTKKKLGFSKFHPHMLRHTCATNLLKNGADLETVRQILGHSDIKQTQLYLHLDTDYIHSVYDKCMK